MRKIILLEDDPFLPEAIKGILLEIGFDCETFASLAKAETQLNKPAPFAALVDLAIPTAKSKTIKRWGDHNDHNGGLAFIKAAKQKWPKTKFVLLAGQPSLDAREWCVNNGVHYIHKPVSKSQLESIFGLRQIVAFIVHGRDLTALKKVKTALKELAIKPIILMEQPSKGMTVIEKFETVSEKCDYAIVAMSADDVGRLTSSTPSKNKLRARQNVIFELGFFWGHFGRTSGRVVLIEFGNTEIPSDIAGIVRINGSIKKSELLAQLKAELTP